MKTIQLTKNKTVDLDLYGGHDPRYLPAYTQKAVAHHVGIPLPTLKSWVKGRTYPVQTGLKQFKPLITPPNNSDAMLSFTNLVEVHVLNAIRRTHKVPLPRVREALDYLAQKFNSDHPLAEHEFQTDGLDLFVEMLGEIVNVSRRGQLGIREVLEAHLSRIDRDLHGNALRLYPFLNFSQLAMPKYVVIDPFISFGKPIVHGTNIATAVIASRFAGGDTIAVLAADFQIEEVKIEEAIRFEQNQRVAA